MLTHQHIVLPLLASFGLACNGNGLTPSAPPPPPSGPVASVTLTPTQARVPVGDSLALMAIARNAGGQLLDSVVTFSVDSPVVATVSPAGVVYTPNTAIPNTGGPTGLHAGPATITATSGHATSIMHVSVPIPAALVVQCTAPHGTTDTYEIYDLWVYINGAGTNNPVAHLIDAWLGAAGDHPLGVLGAGWQGNSGRMVIDAMGMTAWDTVPFTLSNIRPLDGGGYSYIYYLPHC